MPTRKPVIKFPGFGEPIFIRDQGGGEVKREPVSPPPNPRPKIVRPFILPSRFSATVFNYFICGSYLEQTHLS